VLLLSGGIDSPVAGYELMRRGCEIVPLYVDLGDYGGPDHRARAVETAGVLRRYAPGRLDRLWVAPAGDLVADLAASVGDTRMLSLRRAMLAVAETLAESVGAHSVATGEALGQKSSQTGANLATTDAAVSLPVHRPLLTRDKNDVTEQARRIDTFEDSTLPVGCERVAPPHPETNATLTDVVSAEPDDLLDRARSLVAAAEVVDL
jgi:thiamine biosynthesis protein ThiI